MFTIRGTKEMSQFSSRHKTIIVGWKIQNLFLITQGNVSTTILCRKCCFKMFSSLRSTLRRKNKKTDWEPLYCFSSPFAHLLWLCLYEHRALVVYTIHVSRLKRCLQVCFVLSTENHCHCAHIFWKLEYKRGKIKAWFPSLPLVFDFNITPYDMPDRIVTMNPV